MIHRRFGWLVMVGGLAASGCGAGLHPVPGVVTMDGAPVSGANVTFVSEDGSKTFSAPTGADGKFTMTSGEKSGVEAGTYKVLVVKTAVLAGTENLKPSDPEYAKHMQQAQKEAAKASQGSMPPGLGAKASVAPPKSELPAMYGSAVTTPLSVTVPLQSSPLTIDLKQTGAKK